MRLPSFTGEASLYKTRHFYRTGNVITLTGRSQLGAVPQFVDDPCGCDEGNLKCLGLCTFALIAGPADWVACIIACYADWALCTANCPGGSGGNGGGGPSPCCPPGTKCSCGGSCVARKGGGQMCVGGDARCLRPGQECP